MLVRCNAKTCTHNKSDMCKADTIEMKDFSWYSEENKEEVDEMKCSSYEYDKNYSSK
ncbi:MAG: DUF1540 domain-containing protein [Clostridium sp.]|uniref:DUF1540 domain-containing protein n=1 Tax=Clostridium sp. TaxID=1506 RepID=UPI0025B99177|nr:DUF1540 domain-containing protein [Clostridium sp.]MCE5221303.1 DUF1540 domain-containing protein [Clostridium sp.]